jgi:hypothetical protein
MGDAQQIAAGNAGWRLQFRFAVHDFWPRAPELWALAAYEIADTWQNDRRRMVSDCHRQKRAAMFDVRCSALDVRCSEIFLPS